MDIGAITKEIKSIFEGVSFPAHKKELTDAAEKQGAGTDTKEALQKLPDEQFGSVEEVLKKLPISGLADELKKFL